jgi:hypothetical protein
MAPENFETNLITDVSVREYFRDSVTAALSNQNVRAAEDTVYYVVNLLACFTRAEKLFSGTPDGTVLQPLALIYAEAVEAANPEERQHRLRRLGDVALVIAGLFSSSLNRKVVDVDYYIAMGGTAYGCLCDLNRGSARGRVFYGIFEELSKKFQAFVEVLSEVGEKTQGNSSTDIMRLYELWIKTGSKRNADRLRKLGIEPYGLGMGACQLN